MSYREFSISPTRGELAEQYDLFIAALGYESRCTHASRHLSVGSGRRVAVAFEGLGDESKASYRLFEELSFDVEVVRDSDVASFVTRLLADLPLDGPMQVAVDISSFTRSRLADIVSALCQSGPVRPLIVDFLYAPAVPPSEISEEVVPIEIAAPLGAGFTGLGSDPSLPLTAIVGVGIERDRALGVAEYLDVQKVHAFVPTGVDEAFDELARAANRDFFLADYDVRLTEYDIMQPFDLFSRLESLCYGLSFDSRVSLVPLGPKIFALVSLLVAAAAEYPVAVWRFSEGSSSSKQDVKAAGPIAVLQVVFSKRAPEEVVLQD